MKISVCCSGSKESLVKPSALSAYAKGKSNKKNSAFTLAEMMVVMLIMSIILAAMAPVMTTRSKADSSSPWRFSPNNSSDAYFGIGDAQIAMIGQSNWLETDDYARLIINSSDNLKPQISFKRNNNNVGRLYLDTKHNIILGNSTMDKLTDGDYNIVIGVNNLTNNTTGQSNIAIGDSALSQNTTGRRNTAIGTCLGSNTSGFDNTALGDDSLVKNTTGNYNVAVGVDALASAINASWNIAIGKNAYQNGTGGSNTIIGGDAMSKYSGENNVAVGTNALWYGNGNGNVSIGANSNYKSESMTTFNNSTAVGFSAYGSGENSVALGYNANATNNDSIAIGDSVSSSGESAIAIGSYAASNGTTTASDNAAIAIGDGTKSEKTNAIALGTIALASGSNAIGIGYNSQATTSDSIAIGSGSQVVSSQNNNGSIAIGKNAKITNAYCSLGYCSYGNSVAIGSEAKSDASDSISIGYSANATKAKGIAIGYNAIATAESIAIGVKAGSSSNGEQTVAIGYNACKYISGSNKTCIGSFSGASGSTNHASDNKEVVYIGSSSSTVYIPGKLIVGGAVALGTSSSSSYVYVRPFKNENMAVIVGDDYKGGDDNLRFGSGADAIDTASRFSGFTISSDKRLKYIGLENKSGLEKIRQLKVFNYSYKKDKSKTPHVGVIAQDLQKIFPNAVRKGADGFLTIRMEDMFYAMINAIKELDLKYQAQEKRINELEQRIEKLEAKIK